MSDSPDGRRQLAMPSQFNLAATVRGAKNPVMVGPTESLWSTRTPDGPGSLVLQRTGDGSVEASAWGPGSDWLLAQAPRLLGADDDLTGFRPEGELGRRWRRSPFLLARTDRLWDAVVGAVFGQKVQIQRAVNARRALARRFGDPAPGPHRAWILPSPERVAAMGYFEFHPLGVEKKRADILIRVARELPRIERSSVDDPAALQTRLQRVRGIGPWTAAMVSAVTLGDPDAVPVGDYHLPNTVAWNLAGEPRGTDERMLELLEPYAGHRWRVLRLVKGQSAPKYGPKLSLTADGLNQGW
ncbi:MAG: DNA-3-methyladenine glycosylase 2 family protein [Actinomycetota bacterium]